MPEPLPISQTKNTPQITDALTFGAELLKTIIIVGLLAFVIRTFLVQPFIVEGESMSPYFHTNDYLIVDKLSYSFSNPKRGDIIVFKYPNDTSVNYVKRVIGLPGDTIKVADGHVTVNGHQLQESYLAPLVATQMLNGRSQADYTVPNDSFFVLGDNRPNSSDSREWGFMPKTDLIGRVAVELLPVDQAKLVSRVTYAL